MAEITHIILLAKDEPMATEPIYLSTDDSEFSTPNTTPDHHHESYYPDSINQLIASQLEQRSNMGRETVFYPPTPKTSMITDDEEQANLTPIVGNHEQYTWMIPQRGNHPFLLTFTACSRDARFTTPRKLRSDRYFPSL